MTISRYMEVASALARTIDAGTYREREALPPERTLSEEFEVSRETIRKAIKLLEAQGYLVSRQGLGTFVAPDALRDMQRSIDGWTDEAAQNGRIPGQELLSVGTVAAPLSVATALGLPRSVQLVRIHRIRTLDGVPIGLQDSHIWVDKPHLLTREALTKVGSLYRLLAEEFGVVLTDAAESISAAAATGDEARWLGIAPEAPLLRIERVTVAEDLRPVEFCIMKYAQSYRYDTVVRRRSVTN
ncbi:HTH-type transcriptional repressor DasR [compost metagenome]